MNHIYKNFVKLGTSGFIGSMPALELVEAWKNKEILYVAEAQRGMKMERNPANGELRQTPVHFKKNITAIKNSILNGMYFPDEITLNAFETEQISYSEPHQEITCTKALALIDGYHRISALVELSETKIGRDIISHLDFPIKITVYEMAKAKKQFYQFTLGSKVSSSRAAYLNNTNESSLIAERLLSDKDSPLYKRINIVSNSITSTDRNNLVTFATLTNAIENSYDTKTITCSIERDAIVQHIKSFITCLFDMNPEFNSYELRKELRKENDITCDNFTWYAYMHISRFLMDKPDLRKNVMFLKSISFHKSAFWLNDVVRTSDKETIHPDGTMTVQTRYSVVNGISTRRTIGTDLLRELKKLIFAS